MPIENLELFTLSDTIIKLHIYSQLSLGNLLTLYRLFPQHHKYFKRNIDAVIYSLMSLQNFNNAETQMLMLPQFSNTILNNNIDFSVNLKKILNHIKLPSSTYHHKLTALFFLYKDYGLFDINLDELNILLQDAARGNDIATKTLYAIRDLIPSEKLVSCFATIYNYIMEYFIEEDLRPDQAPQHVAGYIPDYVTGYNPGYVTDYIAPPLHNFVNKQSNYLLYASRLISIFPHFSTMESAEKNTMILCLISHAMSNNIRENHTRNKFQTILDVLKKLSTNYEMGIFIKKIVTIINNNHTSDYFDDNLFSLTLAIAPQALSPYLKRNFLTQISGSETYFTYRYDIKKLEALIPALTQSELAIIYHDALLRLGKDNNYNEHQDPDSTNNRRVATGLIIFSYFVRNKLALEKQLILGFQLLFNIRNQVKYPAKNFFWPAVDDYIRYNRIDDEQRDALLTQAWNEILPEINPKKIASIPRSRCDFMLPILHNLLSINNLPSARTYQLFQKTWDINFRAYITFQRRREYIFNNFIQFAPPQVIDFLMLKLTQRINHFLDKNTPPFNSFPHIKKEDEDKILLAMNVIKYLPMSYNRLFEPKIDFILQIINNHQNAPNSSILMLKKLEVIMRGHASPTTATLRIVLINAINEHIGDIIAHPQNPMPDEYISALLSLLHTILVNSTMYKQNNEEEIVKRLANKILQIIQSNQFIFSFNSKLTINSLLPHIKCFLSDHENINAIYEKWDDPALHFGFIHLLRNKNLSHIEEPSMSPDDRLQLLGRGFVNDEASHSESERCTNTMYRSNQSEHVSLSLMSKASRLIFWPKPSVPTNEVINSYTSEPTEQDLLTTNNGTTI